MTIMMILPALITFIVGYLLIKYPISISVPTERGMHKNNIASSGGIAILIGIISFLIIDTPRYFYIGPVLMLIIVALIGYIDDKKSLGKLFRFGSQILVSIVIVNTPYTGLDLILKLFSIILIIYTINIYNFMDGIDQLAISQAIFFTIGSAMLFLHVGTVEVALIFISFYLLNYKNTKIFLGNSGSYLLGLYIAMQIVLIPTNSNTDNILVAMFIFMTTFYVDATHTIINRFFKKFSTDATIVESIEHITQAHRLHAYQKLAIKYNSHSKVVFLMMSYNYIWCLPLAYIAYTYDYFLIPVLLSYLPYIYYCYINKAGTES